MKNFINHSKGLIFIIILSLIHLLGSTNCTIESPEEYDTDPIDTRLPQYTETGKHVGGAIINGQAWKTDYPCSRGGFPSGGGGCNNPMEFLLTRDTLNYGTILSFDGYIMDNEPNKTDLTIYFGLSNLFEKYESIDSKLRKIENLDGKIIILDGVNNFGGLLGKYNCKGGKGQIHFRKVKGTHISGTFGFEIRNACGNVDVHYGRFDFTTFDLY
jgi:hypothetical protein